MAEHVITKEARSDQASIGSAGFHFGFSWRCWCSNVIVTTIHQSKGMEFDIVTLLDAVRDDEEGEGEPEAQTPQKPAQTDLPGEVGSGALGEPAHKLIAA